MQSTELLFSNIVKNKNPKKYVSLAERWANDPNPFKVLKQSEAIEKFNPYHDSLGRFTTGGNATSFTYKPGTSVAHDKAISREKERGKTTASISEPKAEQKERGHIPFESYEKSLEAVKQELGCDEKQANKYIDGVASYTSENYEAIRAYQQGIKNSYTKKFSRDAKTIEDYISKAPHWNDGRLYRGINLEGDPTTIFKSGTELDMQGTSSWTSDKGVSESFTWGSGTKVIFQCDSISKATAISHISATPSEKEVLVSKDTKYVSKKVTKKGKYYYVEVEEITEVGKSFNDVLKFNPYHDSLGRFASSGSAASFTYKPGASTAHSKAIEREKEKDSTTGKGFKGTLYHGSPNTDIKEFDMKRAGKNTSSGEKLLFFTDSKQMAEDFSYERLDGSSKFFQQRGKKGRVYEVDVEMKNPLDFRKLSDNDIDNILKLDAEGLLTKENIQLYAQSNHQLLKAGLTLTAESLQKLGYDGLIANTGKAGHNSLEYAVVDSKQAKIKKSVSEETMTDNKNIFDSSYKIVKTDTDKKLVFGWALVSATSDGQPIIDHQGDVVEQSELEQGAYEYVLNFRDAGEEHISTLRKKARMVESVVFTEEKLRAMGIPTGTVPYGWWIGFYVDDDKTWELIKNGTYKMFSIEGKGIREPVSEPLMKSASEPEARTFSELLKFNSNDSKEKVAKTFNDILKFNPYHDRLGRFTFANGFGVSSSLFTGDPDTKAVTFSANPKTRAGAMAIARHGGVVPTAYGDDFVLPKRKEKPKKEKPQPEEPKTEETGERPRKGLESGLGKEHAQNIENIVKTAPKEYQDVWNKYGDEIVVSKANHKGTAYCDGSGQIAVNIATHSTQTKLNEPYEVVMHESGHSIDRAISRKIGKRFSEKYKDGLFEETLKKEAEGHIKRKQKELENDEEWKKKNWYSLTSNGKVRVGDARIELGRELRKGSFKETGDVSDIFEGATLGKIHGTAGHGKDYWHKKTAWGTITRSVAIEAFAEMFSATTTNSHSLANIKKYFPESYKVFNEMLGYAAKL